MRPTLTHTTSSTASPPRSAPGKQADTQAPTQAIAPPPEATRGSGHGQLRIVRLGDADHHRKPYDRPAPRSVARPDRVDAPATDTGTAAPDPAPDAELMRLFQTYQAQAIGERLRTPSPPQDMHLGESKAAAPAQGFDHPPFAAVRIAPDPRRGSSYHATRAEAFAAPHAGDAPAARAASADSATHAAASALLSMAGPGAPGATATPAAPAAPVAPPATLDPEEAHALQAEAEAALDPATFPRTPWGSETWNAERALRGNALSAWYRTCTEPQRASAFGQALDSRSFPVRADDPVAHDQARAVRLIQMATLIDLMSPEARDTDFAHATRHTALPGPHCKPRAFEQSQDLCRLRLMAHHERMTRAERWASWRDATRQSHLAATAPRGVSRKSWNAIRELRVRVAFAHLQGEDQDRALAGLLDPTPFVHAARAGASAPGIPFFQWTAWTLATQHLPLASQRAMLLTALESSTPGCELATTPDQVRAVRCEQVIWLAQLASREDAGDFLARFRDQITLPRFAPDEEAWEFAAALRTTAARRMYQFLPVEAKLAEWQALLGPLRLPQVPGERGSQRNAMRQRMDQIAMMARYLGLRHGDMLWDLATDARSMPPLDPQSPAWTTALTLRTHALEQLRSQVSPTLRAAALARSGVMTPLSAEDIVPRIHLIGDNQRILDFIGAFALTQDPQAPPALARQMLGTNHGQIGQEVTRAAPRVTSSSR